MQNKQFDVIIVGAGAAGLMCAQIAASRNHKVLVLDHSHKLAEKIRISGGGRCNFTNLNVKPECYISQNKHYPTSALSRYRPEHFTELLDSYNITYHEKTLGQLFCDESSQTIIDLLDYLCREHQVTRLMQTTIYALEREPTGFICDTSRGKFKAEKLVIATGGLSIPASGASGFGYSIAKQFGLELVQTSPALVPLTLSPQLLTAFKPLAGVSFLSSAQIGKINFLENSLFTHRGLSGPAILQISSYWDVGVNLKLDLLPLNHIDQEILEYKHSNKLLSNFLSGYFSQRLANNLCKILGYDKALAQLSHAQIESLRQLIHEFNLTPSGTAGYKKAEVTRGGVDTTCLNSKSMMASSQTGLYFIGEVVDVTGWLGGYNFQWAWASAHAAATSF